MALVEQSQLKQDGAWLVSLQFSADDSPAGHQRLAEQNGKEAR